MKAAAFDYLRPTSLDQAIEMLANAGDSAKVLAGGQTLVPMMAFRLAQPSVLVDLNRIDGLSYIREDGGVLRIGAMTRHREVERSELVRRYCPMLAQAIRWVAHPVIRNRGTAGGSLCHADPAAEWPTVAVALRAVMLLRSPRGARRVAAGDFFTSLLTTAVEADEILVEIELPKARANSGAAFLEVSRRHGDFALVSVAAALGAGRSGEIDDVRLALGGVAMVPVDASRTAEMLLGRKPAEPAFDELGSAVARELAPPDDIHASALYRQEVAAGLVARALAAASKNLRGE